MAIAIVVILTPAAALVLYRSNSSARAERLLAELKRDGKPVTAADLEEFYSLPDGTVDTAPLWMAATAALKAQQVYDAAAAGLPIVGVTADTQSQRVPLPGAPWPQQAAAEKHLADYAESLRQMHEAAKVGGPGRYPTDFEKGFAMLLPEVQGLVHGKNLLELEARVKARGSDSDGVAESIHAMLRLAESLEREPILVSQLVRCAAVTSAVGALEDLFPHVQFSDESLTVLQKDLERANFRTSFQRALQGERVLGAEAFHDVALLNHELGRVRAAASRFTRDDDLALYMEFMQRLDAAAARPWPQAQSEIAAIVDEVEYANGSLIAQSRYAVTTRIVPGVKDSLGAMLTAEARARVAASALAAERHRRKHGSWPATLRQVTPEFLKTVYADPFDGQPLRYLPGDRENTVYSVGRNVQDDAGQEQDRSGAPDVAFTIRLPEKQDGSIVE